MSWNSTSLRHLFRRQHKQRFPVTGSHHNDREAISRSPSFQLHQPSQTQMKTPAKQRHPCGCPTPCANTSLLPALHRRQLTGPLIQLDEPIKATTWVLPIFHCCLFRRPWRDLMLLRSTARCPHINPASASLPTECHHPQDGPPRAYGTKPSALKMWRWEQNPDLFKFVPNSTVSVFSKNFCWVKRHQRLSGGGCWPDAPLPQPA